MTRFGRRSRYRYSASFDLDTYARRRNRYVREVLVSDEPLPFVVAPACPDDFLGAGFDAHGAQIEDSLQRKRGVATSTSTIAMLRVGAADIIRYVCTSRSVSSETTIVG